MTLKELSEVLVESRFKLVVFRWENNEDKAIDGFIVDYEASSGDKNFHKYLEYKGAGAEVKWINYNSAEEMIEIDIRVQ